MNTENLVKWGAILILGYLALRWFTNLAGSVISAGSGDQGAYGPSDGVPYMPGGMVVYQPYAVTSWSPDHRRGRGDRWTYGGYSPDEASYVQNTADFAYGGGINGPGFSFNFGG